MTGPRACSKLGRQAIAAHVPTGPRPLERGRPFGGGYDDKMRTLLRIGTYNPMHVATSYRLQEVSAAFRLVSVLGLIGTATKEWTTVGHTRRKTDDHVVIQFGYDNGGAYTNRSAGCALLFGPPFKEAHIHCIHVPPFSLRGRGGAVALTRGGTRFKLILAYYPPCPWVKKEIAKWRATCKALQKWVADEWRSTPHRFVPILLTDANAQLMHDEDDGAVGRYGLVTNNRPSETGTALTTWMQQNDATSINTHYDTGPTYISREGCDKTID